MKYLKKFESAADKNAWLAGSEFVTPNVVLTGNVIEYNIVDPSLIPLHIEALENLTISFGNTYEYSKDNATWSSGTKDTSISASAGEKVYFKASGLTPSSSSGIGAFTISGKCNVAGDVMSMAYGADFKGKTAITNNYQFYKLFGDCSAIVDASSLALPATTLAQSCYGAMFVRCTSLVNAPALPATALAQSCYSSMFQNCTSLVNAPALPATTLAQTCYGSMFRNCTSLVNAPALPATALQPYCYQYMFRGCSNLAYIKAMFTTKPSSSYTDNWVDGVASIGKFIKNSAATWDVTGSNGVPSGWTVELADA